MKRADQPAGLLATNDELSYLDWQRRLEQALRESRRGRHVTLDAYVEQRRRR